MNRRSLVLGLTFAVTLAARPRIGVASALPKLDVYRNPGCSCCEGWLQHMQAAGFAVSMQDDPDLEGRRESLKIPAEMASCHIAMANGLAFVGHVPPQDVIRFLNAPAAGAIGLAVPGMPVGSPGMGPEGSGGPYDVLLLTANAAPTVYASH